MTSDDDGPDSLGEEWWDLLDDSGALVGESWRRGDAGWPEGRFHLVVGVCAVREDGRVLVSRRAECKDWPLDWEFPAGSALAGEDSPTAAARELLEETGLSPVDDGLVLVRRLVEPSAFFDVFTTRVRDADALRPDPAEVCEARWVDLDEVVRMRDAGDFADPWLPRLEVALPLLAGIVVQTATPADEE